MTGIWMRVHYVNFATTNLAPIFICSKQIHTQSDGVVAEPLLVKAVSG